MEHDVPSPDRVRQLCLETERKNAQRSKRKRRKDAAYDAGLVNAVTEADMVDALYAEFRHVALKGESSYVTLYTEDVIRRATDVARARLGAEPSMPRGLDPRLVALRVPMPGWVYDEDDDDDDGWSSTLDYSPEQQCCAVM